jgi:predicted small secreted protein
MIRRVVASTVILVTVLLAAGCNTVAGFGEDITGSARAVQRVM